MSSSIHLPSLVSSHQLRPLDRSPRRPHSFAASQAAEVKGSGGDSCTDKRVKSETLFHPSTAMLTEEERKSAKLRRVSFPPIPRPQDHSSTKEVTSSSTRHSLSEVVARMRFREKTLIMGDAFASTVAPKKIVSVGQPSVNGGGVPARTKRRSDPIQERLQQQSKNGEEGLFKARTSSDSVVVVSQPPAANGFRPQRHKGRDVVRQASRVNDSLTVTDNSGSGATLTLNDPQSTRTRKNGVVMPVRPVPAWITPRDKPVQTYLEIRGAPVLSRTVPGKESSVGWREQRRGVLENREPRRHQLDEDVVMEDSGHGERAVNGNGYDTDGDGEGRGDHDGDGGGSDGDGGGGDGDDDNDDSDVDFDFDEGEDEVEAQRRAKRQSYTTLAVYQRACDRLKVQPAPSFLRQCNVTSMDLSDAGLGPNDVKPIAIALVRDAKVNFLDLSNNALGPIGVSYIAEMLQENSTLYDLNLSGTNPGHEGVKALAETLPHNKTLLYLRLEDNAIEHTEAPLLADIIRFMPKLQGLYLGHNRLGYRGGATIASAIAQNRSLLTLDLHWNHIRRDSAVALIKALAKNSCLRQLNLAWNGLGKEGCVALAQVLPANSSLTELDLTCNRLDLLSLGFLLTGLARNTRLTTLKVGQNPITTEGAKALIQTVTASPATAIREIDIDGVPVDVEFSQMLKEAQGSRLLHVRHEEALTLATSDRTREHDGTNLDRYDPVMVLFEYMKMDNLRVIDMFQYMDVKKRDKLSKGNIRDGLNALKVPVTEHAIDVIVQKLDLNKDGFVELDEMMKVQRDTARQVKLRQIKAKAKNREDESLKGLHTILRQVISKRTEENESRRESQVPSSKTSGGGRKSSVGGLQLTQARYSVTSMKPSQQLEVIPDQ